MYKFLAALAIQAQARVYLKETFSPEIINEWFKSRITHPIKINAFDFDAGNYYDDFQEEYGLYAKKGDSQYGISARIKEPIIPANGNKVLKIRFEMK